MGFFSWKTKDTGESVSNVHSVRGALPCKMLDNAGNVWVEHHYDGYGVFGGMDYYTLLANMNGKATREEGIGIAFSEDEHKKPLIVSLSYDGCWEDVGNEDCECQGFFYDEDYDDEDWGDDE